MSTQPNAKGVVMVLYKPPQEKIVMTVMSLLWTVALVIASENQVIHARQAEESVQQFVETGLLGELKFAMTEMQT